MNNVYDILEICLQEIENGADVDTVLFRYPEFADELRPILDASLKAKSIAVPDPASDVIRRNRAKVLQQAAQLREAKVQPSRRLWSVPLRRVLVSLAVIVALFVSSTGLVRAASTTLPGDNLYPVKRTWEGMRVLFTFNSQLRELYEVEHENERLEELYELFAEGRSAEVDFAGLITRQNGDLWLVAKIPVVISAQTDLRDGQVAVGDAVRVRGVTQADGTVLAERVDVLDAGMPLPEVDDDDDDEPEIEHENSGNENENESGEDNSSQGSATETSNVQPTRTSKPQSEPEKSNVEGTVDSVNGNIVVVDGQPMDISNAEIKGTPAAGADVKVEGYYDASGIFIVTKIEFLKSDSGGGDDSNDNDNDDSNNDSSDDDNDNDDSNNDSSDDDDDSGKDDDGGGGDDDDNGDDSSGSGGDGDDD